MAIVIVYDSIFGNTAQIAKAIAEALEMDHQVRLWQVAEAKGLGLSDVEMLIVGSPTRGFRPTPAISEFLAELEPLGAGKPAAGFDTRIALDEIHPAPLRWVVEAGGYAASRIDTLLTQKGFISAGEPEGFLVTGTEGPLREGEVARARTWARSLL